MLTVAYGGVKCESSLPASWSTTKHDIPVGEYKWLTVVSPEGPEDIELSLDPNANPAAKNSVVSTHLVIRVFCPA
jgi:hypothetical protein